MFLCQLENGLLLQSVGILYNCCRKHPPAIAFLKEQDTVSRLQPFLNKNNTSKKQNICCVMHCV